MKEDSLEFRPLSVSTERQTGKWNNLLDSDAFRSTAFFGDSTDTKTRKRFVRPRIRKLRFADLSPFADAPVPFYYFYKSIRKLTCQISYVCATKNEKVSLKVYHRDRLLHHIINLLLCHLK